jgi:allantoate deiminase
MSERGIPDASRIWERCEALARHSERPDGLTRVFLSPELRAATDLVGQWMRAAGMAVRIDAIGNVVGRYEGATPGAPCLMLGSHLDTVRDAGKYDGMLGVVCGIEVVSCLAARGVRLPHAVEVIGFADEEGVRFGATLLGSRAVAGTFDPSVLSNVDAAGIAMRDAMRGYGLDPARIGEAARTRGEVLAYAELHIEQGPVLESEGLALGVVTAINGATRFRVSIDGLAGHAGTSPMALRRDALAAAAECVLAIERRARATADLVATVGVLEASPGAANVIPGRVRFSIDIRSPRDADRLEAVRDLSAELRGIATRRGVAIDIERTHESATAACAGWMRDRIGAALEAVGCPRRELPSGAGHDGMALVGLADIGMLFVRCKAGISHHPAEAIDPADAQLAARAFLHFVEHFQPRRGAA